MAPGDHETLLNDDPRLAGGEWLFRRGEQVFGPVDSRGIAAMLYRGDVDGRTLVSAGDGAWVAIAEVPLFLVHAKKAEAALRVEREVTGQRLLRERRRRRRAIAVAIGVVLLVVGAGGGGFLLARRRAATSPLLEDFGAGIRIASAARVGVSSRAPEDEVEVTLEPLERPDAPRRDRPPGRSAPAATAPRASGDVEGGELVASHFDERKIQAVVAREQRTLVPCFREEASRSPDFRGDVPIEFAIGNDGRVASLWIDEPRFRSGTLRDCVERALGSWRFESFPGQRPTVSLAFRIGG